MILKLMLAAWVLPILLAAGGCGELGYLLYVIAPPDKPKTVEAEFKNLEGQTVAMVFYADQKVLYEYPNARAELSAAMGEQLRANVKTIKLVDSRKVLALQDQKINWDTMSKSDLGRQFGADYVLQVTLMEFTMRDEGSINIYRGKIVAEASLYKVGDPNFRDDRVWHCDDIHSIYPEKTNSGVPAENDIRIRNQTIKLFVERVAWKFYKHEEPVSL